MTAHRQIDVLQRQLAIARAAQDRLAVRVLEARLVRAIRERMFGPLGRPA